jgi:hypothetical protein
MANSKFILSKDRVFYLKDNKIVRHAVNTVDNEVFTLDNTNMFISNKQLFTQDTNGYYKKSLS